MHQKEKRQKFSIEVFCFDKHVSGAGDGVSQKVQYLNCLHECAFTMYTKDLDKLILASVVWF
jgi:hypothetical protein